MESTKTEKLTEEVQLSGRFVSLTGILDQGEATIYQENVRGQDLTGNTVFDVDVSPQPLLSTFVMEATQLPRKGRDDTAQQSSRGPSVFVGTWCGIPKAANRSSANLAFVVRVLHYDGRGHFTYGESDDEVVTVDGTCTVKNSVELVDRPP